MKPCLKNQEPLAWLALGELDEAAAQDLRTHLETCEGCRRYLGEISTITRNLATLEIDSNIQTSESFHQRVVRKLDAEQPLSIWQIFRKSVWPILPNWRFTLAATSAAACLAFLAVMWWPATRPQVRFATATTPSPSTSKPDLAPTLANYQMVANHSLEQFDELLSKQGNRNSSSSRTYAASRMEE